MALTIKSLGVGTIKNTTAKEIVAGSLGKSTFVKNVSLVNNHTANAVLSGMYVRRYTKDQTGYNDYPVSPRDLTITAKTQIVLDTEITLANSENSATPTPAIAADQLVLTFSTIDSTNGVTYVVNGFERDL